MRRLLATALAALAVACTTPDETPRGRAANRSNDAEAIPFEFFASFERIESGNPVIALEPPLQGDTVL